MTPESLTGVDLIRIKKSFEENENVLALLRREGACDENRQVAIQISYDLQAGSYVKALQDPEYIDFKNRVCREMASVVSEFSPHTVLEAGVGEATSLAGVIEAFPSGSRTGFAGFDLSWSRCLYAKEHLLKSVGKEVPVFVGGLESIPMESDSIDVVYTAHAIEPNHGRERHILRELHRVAQRYIILFEPAYEFACREIRERMDEHGYCRGLADIARDEGWNVIRHEPAQVQYDPNPTAILIIEKSAKVAAAKSSLGCPRCHGPLLHANGHYFCEAEGIVYPVIRGIPCLLPQHAIFASKFLEAFGSEI